MTVVKGHWMIPILVILALAILAYFTPTRIIRGVPADQAGILVFSGLFSALLGWVRGGWRGAIAVSILTVSVVLFIMAGGEHPVRE